MCFLHSRVADNRRDRIRNREISRWMMSENLKPRPFCGSNNVVLVEPVADVPDELFKFAYVHCDDCHADGTPDLGSSGAVEQWNARPLEAERDAQLAELREACKSALNMLSGNDWKKVIWDEVVEKLRRALAGQPQSKGNGDCNG